MDVLDVLDSLIILVELSCSLSPSCEITGADDLVKVIHHLVGELGREEGDSGSIIEQIPCFVGQGFNLAMNPSISPGVNVR